jgi:hypothetical protein
MYTFCSCDATMIPDVDHHQSFSFWDPWLQHYKRNFRHTWTAFSPLTFICLLPASEHLFGFSYGSILMSERISGRHALRHLHNQDNTHDLAVFALLGFLSAGLHFLGYTGLRARHLYFERAASLAALARCLRFILLSCAWKSAQFGKLRFVASQKSKRTD